MNHTRNLRRLRVRVIHAIFVVAAIAMGGAAAHALPIEFKPIALSGDIGTARGLGEGVNYAGDFFSLLNAKGEVAFRGRLEGDGIDSTNDNGIWNNVGGALDLVARTGNAGPGPGVGEDVYFRVFVSFYFNGAGKTLIRGYLTGPGVTPQNEEGLWTNTSGNLKLVARAGSFIGGPGLGPDVFFTDEFTNTAFNDNSQILFMAPDDSDAIWLAKNDSITLLARNGGRTVGLDFETPELEPRFRFRGLHTNAINASGKIAFFSELAGPGIAPLNSSGIWTSVDNTLTLVAFSGDHGPGPGLEPGIQFASHSQQPVINSAGEVASWAHLQGPGVNSTNNAVVWSTAGGTLAIVARSGSDDLGPGLGEDIHFSGFFPYPIINAAGDVAFFAALTGPGLHPNLDGGIWSNAGGELAAVALKRSEIAGPGLGPDVYFNGLSIPSMNANGAIVFVGILEGTGVDSTNDRGIWTNAGGTLQMIFRTGDLFDIDPGIGEELRTISDFTFQSYSGGEDGHFLTFNDDGLLVFSLTFTDGSSGVFTAQIVPEPASALLLGACALAMIRRRR